MSVLSELVLKLKDIKAEKTKVAAEAKELSAQDTETSNAILDELENNNFSRVETCGYLVSSIKKPVAKIIDKSAFCEHVFKTKNVSLVSSRIPNALLEEMALEGEEIAGIEIIELNKLSFTNAKGN